MGTVDILLIGANNPSIIRVIDRINKQTDEKIRIEALLDNDVSKHGTYLLDHKIVGGFERLSDYPPSAFKVINSIASSMKVRRAITKELIERGYDFHTLVDPSLEQRYTKIGKGTVVYENAMLQPNVNIGEHCIISAQSGVAHDSVVGNYVFIGPNSYTCGRCTINDGAYIGTSATIIPETIIGSGAIIGAGAIVTKSLPPDNTYVGMPAKAKF